jgi:hypothetical protein
MSKQFEFTDGLLRIPPKELTLPKELLLNYEVGRTGWLQSELFKRFPNWFMRRFEKRYARYVAFMQFKEQQRQSALEFLEHSSHNLQNRLKNFRP